MLTRLLALDTRTGKHVLIVTDAVADSAGCDERDDGGARHPVPPRRPRHRARDEAAARRAPGVRQERGRPPTRRDRSSKKHVRNGPGAAAAFILAVAGVDAPLLGRSARRFRAMRRLRRGSRARRLAPGPAHRPVRDVGGDARGVVVRAVGGEAAMGLQARRRGAHLDALRAGPRQHRRHPALRPRVRRRQQVHPAPRHPAPALHRRPQAGHDVHRARFVGILRRHGWYRIGQHARLQPRAHERAGRTRVDHGRSAHGAPRRRRRQLRRRRGHPRHTAQPHRRGPRRG